MNYIEVVMYDKFYDVVLPQQEVWKDVRDYEGLYKVSNYGRVRSLDRKRTWWREDWGKFTSRVFKGKILKPKLIKEGYYHIHLRDEDRESHWTVHKLVSEAFHNDLGLPVIDHKDNIKSNNLLWNLRRCTVSYNTKKAVTDGKLICGNTRYSGTLTESIKSEVKLRLAKGESMRSITTNTGVSQRSVARIRDKEQEIYNV